MRIRICRWSRPAAGLVITVALCTLWAPGCASVTSPYSFLQSPFTTFTGAGAEPTADGDGSTFFETGGRASVDPCAEPNSRKFLRISMRNLDPDHHIHYFLVLVAFVHGETYSNGAVCPDDIDLYTAFGYEEIPDGVLRPFGNFCIEGPALLYFHRNGQFRRAGGVGGAELGSAIAPAQGTNATFDAFFTSGGASVPVPDLIIFHNPGTGEGAALKISLNSASPCAIVVGDIGDPECEQDSFYYVDEFDLLAGSVNLGAGSGRRVPNEVQGTGCECGAVATFGTSVFQAAQVLAPSGVTASNARCNEFLRGGLIEYVFVLDDANPPFPQLLWRVTDQSGAEAHDFDTRANIP